MVFHAYRHLTLTLQFSSVAQLCPTLCNPMDCNTLLPSIKRILDSRGSLFLLLQHSSLLLRVIYRDYSNEEIVCIKILYLCCVVCVCVCVFPWWDVVLYIGNVTLIKFNLTSLMAQMVVCLHCRRPRFDPWFGKIPWRRTWQPTPVFSPGKSQGQRSLVGYSPWGREELDTTERLHFLSYK